ncbi:MAG: GIY-YIG nuclease family protein [Nitrospirae bacterium]|nr:GIY-YIG nuclease family protein [Nitrospirota bacterium]
MSDKDNRSPLGREADGGVPKPVASKAASWTAYLVECRDGSLYAGCTTDVERRVAQHNAGRGGAYTRSRRPVIVRYVRACESEAEAKRVEAAIKSWPRSRKLALCLEPSA